MRILTTAALTAGLLWAGAASAADALAECYRTADNKVAVQACLKKELDQTQKEYDDIVDRILAKARDLDRIQKRRNEAAKAFERYVDAECGWLEESYGAGTGSGNAVLACRINLIKTRSGALDAQFLSASH